MQTAVRRVRMSGHHLGSVRLLLAIFLAGLLGACQSAPTPVTGGTDRRVYVVNHGWHTGIAVATTDIPPGAWPVAEKLVQARYIEVG